MTVPIYKLPLAGEDKSALEKAIDFYLSECAKREESQDRALSDCKVRLMAIQGRLLRLLEETTDWVQYDKNGVLVEK